VFVTFSCDIKHEPKPCEEAFSKMYYAKEKGQFDESLIHIEEYGKCVFEGHEKYPMVYYYHKGWALYELEKYQEAIESFNAGMLVQKDYPFAHFRRGLAYEALGKKEAAESDYEITYKLGMGYDTKEFTKIFTESPLFYEKLKKYIELNKPNQKDAK
jgi:tetratricopeptide (TPR) repeat protein